MPNVIDSLIVTLGLDVTKFQKGQKDASGSLKNLDDDAVRTAKELEARGKQAAQFFGQIRNQVIGLLAAFTAGKGLGAFVTDITVTDAAAGRLARNLGMSVDQFTAWQGAVRQSGGSADGAAASFNNLVQQFQQLSLTGQSAVVPYFRALGVTIADSEGKMRPMNDILLDLADRFSKMDPARAQAFGAAMGIDPGTINTLIQGRGALKNLLDEQEKLGHVNKADAAAAIERQSAWRALTQSSEDLGRKILTDLTPAINSMVEALTRFSEWAHEHPKLVEAAFAAISVAVGVLTTALVVSLVGSAIPVVIAAFSAMAAAATVAFGPIGAAVTGLGIAAYELVKHWDGIKEWWHNLWGDMADDAKSGSDSIQDAQERSSWDTQTILGQPMPATRPAPGAVPPPGSAPAPGAAAISADDVAKLQGMGWTREQAIGIAANLQRESGGNARAVGDKGQAYGLGQWHPDRQADFEKWSGHSIRESSRDEQLAFVNYELRQGKEKRAGDSLSKATDAASAAAIVSRNYERPADASGESAIRANMARILAGGIPPDRGIATGASAALASNVTNNSTQNAGNTTHSETSIGTINIQTQAQDAKGIAASIGNALEKYSFVTQANYGLS